jgi:hypothetical protein
MWDISKNLIERPLSFLAYFTGYTAALTHCQLNGRILLVILFPRDTAAVTVLDSRDFWAFNEGIYEVQFSELGG